MKLSFFLSAFLSASAVSASSRRVLHENATDLSNGAVLSIEVASPVASSFLTLGPNDTTASLDFKGKASVGKGEADVAYIYIIDSSGSTDEHDGDCGSTLDCVQGFFEELHNDTMAHGSSELVAVIDFDDTARVVAEFQSPGNAQVLDSIHGTSSYGGTACSHALETATLLVHQQKQADTTIVIFAGDGRCNGGDESATVVSEDVTEAADLLGDTGAIVHSIAVGDNVNCDTATADDDWSSASNDLVNIPRNGGKCFSIPEPKALPGIIDDLIGTTLTSVAVSVDGSEYRALSSTETKTALPAEGSVTVGFETKVFGLTVGEHEVCIRATGEDSLGGVAETVDCHKVVVRPAPTPVPTASPTTATPTAAPTLATPNKPNKAFNGTVIAGMVVGCIVVLAGVAHLIKRRAFGGQTDLAMEEEAEVAKETQGSSYSAPNVV